MLDATFEIETFELRFSDEFERPLNAWVNQFAATHHRVVAARLSKGFSN